MFTFSLKQFNFSSSQRFIFLAIVSVASYFTFVHNYQNPAGLFWDENYYIASAQKYLNHVFFMHDHPPLGKLLIALGEYLVDANPVDNQYINVDHIKGDLPEGFSLRGYRLFPVLCGWLSAPLFYGLLLHLTKKDLYAFLLSFLYIFDNAMIVHFRGAMLDSVLIFLIISYLFIFVSTPFWKGSKFFYIASFMNGAVIGLAATTKLTGLIIAPLAFISIFYLIPDGKKIITFLSLAFLGFICTFYCIWQIHFSLSQNINPNLKNNGLYGASSAYQETIKNHQQSSLLSFPIMLNDSWHYMTTTMNSVPAINFCNEHENGSLFFMWPFGSRAINYRWTTDNDIDYRYLYLQSNPIIWFCGLSGVIFTTNFLFAYLFHDLKIEPRFELYVFLFLYWSYMTAIASISRVMYLYHYFPALIFSFCLFAITIADFEYFCGWILTPRIKSYFLYFCAALMVISFWFYSPLTYYQPLNQAEFAQRVIVPLWDLQCVNCNLSEDSQ